jgi:hypothetical protein
VSHAVCRPMASAALATAPSRTRFPLDYGYGEVEADNVLAQVSDADDIAPQSVGQLS